MEYEVSVAFNGFRKSYPIQAESHYNARIQALELFLPEFKIPGTPVEYVTKKTDTMEISVRKILDRRKIPRVFPQMDFYTGHVERLRRWIREGELPEDKKVRITGKLLEIGKILNE